MEIQYSWIDIDRAGLNLAVGLEYEWASADSNLIEEDEGRVDEKELYLTIAKDLDSWSESQVFAQIGKEFEGDEHTIFLNLGGYWTPSRNRSYSLELNLYELPGDRFLAPTMHGTVTTADWAWSLGFPLGLTKEADRYQIVANVFLEYE